MWVMLFVLILILVFFASVGMAFLLMLLIDWFAGLFNRDPFSLKPVFRVGAESKSAQIDGAPEDAARLTARLREEQISIGPY